MSTRRKDFLIFGIPLIEQPETDEVIASFNSLNLEDTESDGPKYIIPRRQVSMQDKSFRIATIVISVLLVSLVLIWWHSQSKSHEDVNLLSHTNTEVQ